MAIWTQVGDRECIAGAHNNLGNHAMSRGDFQRAQDHHEASLMLSRQIGNVQGSALAYINLALLEIEQGNGQRASEMAKAAVDMLAESGNEYLKTLAAVILGEAHLALGDRAGSRSIFEDILARQDERHHPLAIAASRRGLGRIALIERDYDQAISLLLHAQELFEHLNRVQETARTELYYAQALWQVGEHERARYVLQHARERLAVIAATRDAQVAERMLRDFQHHFPSNQSLES
jgi:tetratricopeptide (TPR) repeat protein